jgi:hypothetical protein
LGNFSREGLGEAAVMLLYLENIRLANIQRFGKLHCIILQATAIRKKELILINSK